MERYVEIRKGPLVLLWDKADRQGWFRLFGAGLALSRKDAWRLFSCRNGKGLHKYDFFVGEWRVCPLRRRKV